MWFLCTQHFGLRGCQEHTTIRAKNFVVLRDINGCEYIEFLEDPTKTRQGGLRPNQRVTNPKMFALGRERCPVRLFKRYLSKRPDDLQNSRRFYLTPKQNVFQTDEIWYTKNPMGKNTISNIMKALIAETPLENCGKKLTNHSIRKTAVKKLKAANVPESSIIKVTGHKSTRGLKSYDPADQNEFREISNALNPLSASPSTSLSIQSVSSSSLSVPKANKPTYVFHDCTVNFNNISQNVKSESRKRKYVIYDTESSQSQ